MIKRDPKNADSVALATSQRVIRQDPAIKEGYSRHFRTFALAVAGRDVGHESFERENIREHLHFFLAIMKKLNESENYTINETTVTLSNVNKNKPELLDIIGHTAIEELHEEFPEVAFQFDTERESDYYNSLCYGISAKTRGGEKPISIAGGGMTDWTNVLVGSRIERLLVGAIGSETLCRYFKN